MTRATLVATVALAAALTAWAPAASLSPGALSPGHRQVPCLSCHVPLVGVPNAQCTGCHRAGSIGVRDGGVAGEALQRLHRGADGCRRCHPAHGTRAAAAFSHASLPADGCEACHGRPETGVHINALACERCHRTEGWRPARFVHQPGDGACATCHEARRPVDALHADGADCGACHGTSDWRGASFDHAKSFPLLGEHQVACVNCHPGAGSFKGYVCTSCHEHSPERLAHEHREEGLADLSDCVRCHRGGGHGSDRD